MKKIKSRTDNSDWTQSVIKCGSLFGINIKYTEILWWEIKWRERCEHHSFFRRAVIDRLKLPLEWQLLRFRCRQPSHFRPDNKRPLGTSVFQFSIYIYIHTYIFILFFGFLLLLLELDKDNAEQPVTSPSQFAAQTKTKRQKNIYIYI